VLDIALTAVNTFVLICSSLTMVMALSAIERGDKAGLRNWLAATALLGLVFLGGQAFEFTKLFGLGVSLGSNLSALPSSPSPVSRRPRGGGRDLDQFHPGRASCGAG